MRRPILPRRDSSLAMAGYGDVKFAAGIAAGIGRAEGNFAAFALDADIRAILREGASDALGRRLDVSQDTLMLGFRGVEIRLEVKGVWRYMPSFVTLEGCRGGAVCSPDFRPPWRSVPV